MRRLQTRRLREQLAHARAHSPFYRRKLEGAPRVKTLDDLRRLPFTTKDELKENQAAKPPWGDHRAAARLPRHQRRLARLLSLVRARAARVRRPQGGHGDGRVLVWAVDRLLVRLLRGPGPRLPRVPGGGAL